MSHIRALTIRSKGGLLRVLKSNVVVSVPFLGDPALQPQPLKQGTYTGIWDTGATGSVITKKIIDALGLKATGQKQVWTAKGPGIANTYLVNIILPSDIHVQHVEVTEGQLSPDCDMLVGMDIVNLGDFSITNQGGVTVMSFRTPSCHEVDFVQRVNEKKKQSLRKKKRF